MLWIAKTTLTFFLQDGDRSDRERNEHAFSLMALVARPFSFAENHASRSTREMRAAPCEINLISVREIRKKMWIMILVAEAILTVLK